jgi:hypothetical protein
MRNKIIKFSLIFGLIAGLLCFGFFLILYAVNEDPLSNRRPDLGINILIIFLAIWLYKQRRGGFLHFYEGFSIGFLTNIIAALFNGILIFLFIKLIDPKPFEALITNGIKFLNEQKEAVSKFLSEENFNLQIKSLQEAKPYEIILDDLMFKQFAIVAIMLISMALRKQSNAKTFN